jgi:hypothetical protein
VIIYTSLLQSYKSNLDDKIDEGFLVEVCYRYRLYNSEVVAYGLM